MKIAWEVLIDLFRKRRVKCDEVAPTCTRCLQYNRACEREAPKPRKPVSHGFKLVAYEIKPPRDEGNPIAKTNRGLEYFYLNSLPVLAQCDPSPLWSYATIQIQNSGLPLRDIASAIGTQHRIAQRDEADSAIHSEACVLYAKAVKRFQRTIREYNSKDAADVTLGCFLFSILESLRGIQTRPLTHLMGAMSVIDGEDEPNPNHTPTSESARMLEQATVSSLVFNPISTTASPVSERAWSIWDLHMDAENLEDDQQLKRSVIRLSSHLTRLMKIANRGANYASFDIEHHASVLWQKQAEIQAAITDRLFHLEQINSESAISLRRAYAQFLLITIIMRNTWTGHQTSYDAETHNFYTILDLVRKSLSELQESKDSTTSGPICFSTGLGVIPTLTIIARLCRNPQTRRDAVRLLRHCPQREGVWDARLGEAACKAIIDYEERKAGIEQGISGDLYIPEECRVHYYEVIFDSDREKDFPASIAIFSKKHVHDKDYVMERIPIEEPT